MSAAPVTSWRAAVAFVVAVLIAVLGATGWGRPVCADAAPASQPTTATETAIARAIDQAQVPLPLPSRSQISIKPSYTFASGTLHYKSDLLFEPRLVYRAFLIPGLRVPGFWSIARIQLRGEGLQNVNGSFSGLTDLTLANVVAHRLGFLALAVGYATVFPTATAPALGQSKLQLGPAVAARVFGIPRLSLAALVEYFHSVAGSTQSPALAYVTVQPFIILHLPAAMFLSSDSAMTFYREGGRTTVPLNLGLGHAFGLDFELAVRVYYTVAGADRGTLKVEALLNFLE
jgi:hypothetical protein